MQRPPAAVLVIAGLAIGAGLAAAGWWAGGAVGEGQPPPAGTVTAPPAPDRPTPLDLGVSVAPLGPTTLRPIDLFIENGEVVFSYELTDAGPSPVGTFTRPEDDDPVAAPERWMLVTTSGEIEGSTSSVRSRTARFAVPSDFDLGWITALRLERYRVRLPVLHRLEVSRSDTGENVLDIDTSVTLRRVLEQTNGTLVQFLVEHPSDLFTATGGFGASFEALPQVRGMGPGWTNVGPISGGVQLTFVGERLPDPIPITVRTHSWVPIERPITISLNGLPDA